MPTRGVAQDWLNLERAALKNVALGAPPSETGADARVDWKQSPRESLD